MLDGPLEDRKLVQNILGQLAREIEGDRNVLDNVEELDVLVVSATAQDNRSRVSNRHRPTVGAVGPRGFEDGCSGVGSSVDLVMDAYGALLYLADLPFVDPQRIAIVGYSKGADTAVFAVEFDGVERLFDRQFRAAVAYYPFCQRQEAAAVAVPTLILIGERDDWNFARDCQDMVARRRDFSAPMRLVVYPEAQHSFNLKLPPRSHYGHHLEYNEAADRAAWAETVALLRQAFGR